MSKKGGICSNPNPNLNPNPNPNPHSSLLTQYVYIHDLKTWRRCLQLNLCTG